jgi:hypothetical protein
MEELKWKANKKIERLRKIQIEDKINWEEALPAILDRIHDIPG